MASLHVSVPLCLLFEPFIRTCTTISTCAHTTQHTLHTPHCTHAHTHPHPHTHSTIWPFAAKFIGFLKRCQASGTINTVIVLQTCLLFSCLSPLPPSSLLYLLPLPLPLFSTPPFPSPLPPPPPSLSLSLSLSPLSPSLSLSLSLFPPPLQGLNSILEEVLTCLEQCLLHLPQPVVHLLWDMTLALDPHQQDPCPALAKVIHVKERSVYILPPSLLFLLFPLSFPPHTIPSLPPPVSLTHR